jgi:hypothetical protein
MALLVLLSLRVSHISLSVLKQIAARRSPSATISAHMYGRGATLAEAPGRTPQSQTPAARTTPRPDVFDVPSIRVALDGITGRSTPLVSLAPRTFLGLPRLAPLRPTSFDGDPVQSRAPPAH